MSKREQLTKLKCQLFDLLQKREKFWDSDIACLEYLANDQDVKNAKQSITLPYTLTITYSADDDAVTETKQFTKASLVGCELHIEEDKLFFVVNEAEVRNKQNSELVATYSARESWDFPTYRATTYSDSTLEEHNARFELFNTLTALSDQKLTDGEVLLYEKVADGFIKHINPALVRFRTLYTYQTYSDEGIKLVHDEYDSVTIRGAKLMTVERTQRSKLLFAQVMLLPDFLILNSYHELTGWRF